MTNRRQLDLSKAVPPEVKPPKKQQLTDRQHEAHLRALAALKRWESKLRRAETGVRKYRKKVRYYERKASA